MDFAPAVPARGCVGGPQDGAVDLQTHATQANPALVPLGIYACRRVGGAPTTWSVHAEGRAVDLGTGDGGQALGLEVLASLLQVGDQVLQRIIYWHTIYDLLSPGGRAYNGANPHTDHLHVELSWPAARREISIDWPEQLDDEEDPMPILLVAYHGAMWAVRPDLTARVGLSQSTDVTALSRINGGRTYQAATLTAGLMDRIPEVSAL